jgi:hypothetical protein
MMKTAFAPGTVSRPQEITLTADSLWSAYGTPDEIEIDCREGVVWITQEGDRRDIVLHAEQQYRTEKRGLVIVQAVGDARIVVHYERK